MFFPWSTTIQNPIAQGTDVLKYISQTYFNIHAIITLVICVAIGLVLGRIVAFFLRKAVATIGARADKSQNLPTVNRYRRYETYLVLSIALIRVFLVLLSLYFWWLLEHPNEPPTALIGASAILLILVSTSLGPILRDIVAGGSMMIEQWYGVGDHIKIVPFDIQGVVDRVTLRSTRIRELNGEITWVNNQYIQGVRITPKGIRTIALELFVTNLEKGEALIQKANDRLPSGPLLMVSELRITEEVKVGEQLWHITAIGDTAPGREWLIEKAAVDVIKEMDEKSKNPIIAHGPLARYADNEAEKKFKRTITNARKKSLPKKRLRTRQTK
ncbi:MAG: mechanosensitive ion channel MscS, small conductance mechanosensitive channel [Candidatus Saccharibacteria bacterium]|nr:mechanosensitive ion channel MscS, small conductance mechanosensitive channel [Candidatus Saccharibacteria bacterium]